MKTFFACLITCLISVAGATAGNYYLTKQLLKEHAAGNGVAKTNSDQPKKQPAATRDEPKELNGKLDNALNDSDQMAQQLAGIEDDIERLNGMFNAARNDVMRVYHFAAGHVSYSGRGRGGAFFCAECGLIMDLENRQTEIDNQIARLSGQVSELKKGNQTDSQEYKDGVAEINRLQTELDLLQKHLYRSKAMEKNVSTITNTPAASQVEEKKAEGEKVDDKKAEPEKPKGEEAKEAPQEKKSEENPATDSNEKK